jgi:hypothetical protein
LLRDGVAHRHMHMVSLGIIQLWRV